MKNYPEIDVLTRPAQKRGGKNPDNRGSRANRSAFLTQVTAETKVPCGQEFRVMDRVEKEDVNTSKVRFKESVRVQASTHVSKCKVCKSK